MSEMSHELEAQMDFEQFIFPFMVRCSAFPEYFPGDFRSTERDPLSSQRGCAPHSPKGGLGLETFAAVPAIFGVETTGSSTGMEHGCV